MALIPGYRIWEYSGPAITVALSPLLSPWFDTTGYTTIMPAFKFTTGTSVHSIVGSWDGISTDADLTALWATPATGVALIVMSPFFRWQTVQSVADATVSKVFLQARA
ncbi:MAG: hypothetical protein ACLP5E_02160 [Streptosporangiaceae bacterium]